MMISRAYGILYIFDVGQWIVGLDFDEDNQDQMMTLKH